MGDWDAQVVTHETPAGLPCVAVSLPHLHSASVLLYARAGSRYETPETNGIAHFLEHMIFRGTATYPNSYELAAAVESFGASFNAETGRDTASYYIDCVPRNLDRAVDLLAEMFRAPRFADIELEREVVLEEMIEDYNERGLLTDLDTLVKRRVWPRHPLGLPVGGTLENIRRFELADLRTHFDANYTAGNLLLCAAGRVDPEHFFGRAEAAFDFVRPGPAVEQAAPQPGATEGLLFVPDSDSQISVAYAWPAPSLRDPDYPAAGALRRILDDGISSRLHRHLIDGAGLAYSLEASLEGYHDAGCFEIQADLAPAKLPRFVDALSAVLEDLKASAPSEEEMDKIRERALCDLELLQDNPESMADWLAATRLFYEPRTPAEAAERIRAVTGADVQRAAQTILRRDALQVTLVGSIAPKALAAAEKRL